MPRKNRYSRRKRLTSRKGFYRNRGDRGVKNSTPAAVTVDIEDEEGPSIPASSADAPDIIHLSPHLYEPVATKTSTVRPVGGFPTRDDQLTALGDPETVDVLYCVTKPSQSVSRKSDVDMKVYKLSALTSTSETTNHRGIGTQPCLNGDKNTFTVVGMELTESSDDSADEGLTYPVKIVGKPAAPVLAVPAVPAVSAVPNAPRELSVTQQLLDGVSHKRSHSNFLREVKAFLTDLLTIHWACAAVDNKLLVMLMSRADVLCAQRQLTFELDGKVSISVHNDPLPADHDLWTLLPPVITNPSNSVEEFSQYILTIVDLVRQFDVCKGLQDERYGKYTHILRGDMVYDENKYKEARYSKTYRSSTCLKLIVLPRQRCTPCTRLKSMAEKRIKSYESPHPPKPRTNKRYLALYGNHVPETRPDKKVRMFCRVQNCTSIRESWTQNLTLFKPRGDRELLEKWVQLSGSKNLINLPIDRLKRFLNVCHLHFADEDLKGTEVTRILKQNAIPVKFPEGHAPLSEADMNAWKSSKHYKQYWKRLEPKKPRQSKNIIERCPNLPVDSVALNCEPNGPFPCLYCETVHATPTSNQEECLSYTLSPRANLPSSNTSELEGTKVVQEEVANILLSL